MKTLKAYGYFFLGTIGSAATVALAPMWVAYTVLLGSILFAVGYRITRRPALGDFSAKRYWYEARVSGFYAAYLASCLSIYIRLEPDPIPIAAIAFTALGLCCVFMLWMFSRDVKDALEAEAEAEANSEE